MGLFRKTSPIERLEKQHARLLKEAHKLSAINRTSGDAKYAEADEIARKIDKLKSE